MIDNLPEAEVRLLRDAIYGPTTDRGWEACKHNWMKPENVRWLITHQHIGDTCWPVPATEI